MNKDPTTGWPVVDPTKEMTATQGIILRVMIDNGAYQGGCWPQKIHMLMGRGKERSGIHLQLVKMEKNGWVSSHDRSSSARARNTKKPQQIYNPTQEGVSALYRLMRLLEPLRSDKQTHIGESTMDADQVHAEEH